MHVMNYDNKMKLLCLLVVVASAYARCSNNFDCGRGEWCCLDECVSNRITACEKSSFNGVLFAWVFGFVLVVSTCVGIFICVYCHMCCWALKPPIPPNYMLVDN
jgi:hypothetical protein